MNDGNGEVYGGLGGPCLHTGEGHLLLHGLHDAPPVNRLRVALDFQEFLALERLLKHGHDPLCVPCRQLHLPVDREDQPRPHVVNQVVVVLHVVPRMRCH